MTYLDKLLDAQPATLALVAIVLLALSVGFLVTKGRPKVPLALGSLMGPRSTEETLTPAAASYIDGRIAHKVNGLLAEPVLRITRAHDDLREDVERIDREREQMGRDIAVIKSTCVRLESGQESLTRKLDEWLRTRG